MTLKVPDAREIEVLEEFLTPALTLRLFGNDVTPSATSVTADFTEISGGGYAALPLTIGNWGFTEGAPSIALYNAIQRWDFTAAINAPGTIYGYYITRNSDGFLMYAERFPSGLLPFTPIAGSNVRITPRITCES